MTAKEHAEIWRQAARVVAGLDPRLQWHVDAAQAQHSGWIGRGYSETEAAAWDAYGSAAAVLTAIATQYEKVAKAQEIAGDLRDAVHHE